MTYAILPLTNDPWQVFTADVMLDGEPFHAQISVRWLPAAGRWFLSVWDHASGELLVNQVPLVCTCGPLNDLMFPCAHVRGGKGLGSMFCLRKAESAGQADPGRDNLEEFSILFGDTFVEETE